MPDVADENTKDPGAPLADAAPAPTPKPANKRPRKSYQYWGVFQDGGDATPRGAKQYVEQSAAMISNPTQGTGRTVCIKKAEKGSVLGEETGVCYINGVRQKRKK
jgi:hypothetical protein